MLPSQDVHILIPKIWDYVTLHDKRDFTDMIKLRVLKWEIILGYLSGSDVITRTFIL